VLEQGNEWIGKHRRLAGGLLFLATYVVFCGTLSNLFVHDDIPQVLENPFLRNAREWTRIFTGSVWSFRGPAQHDNMYRPLQFITYWALYRLTGPSPAVFHLFLLLFYAATVWLVFRLALRLFSHPLVAFAGALLWALHPLHVEPAAWVSALPDVGSAFFYLLGFLLFVRAEQSETPSFPPYLLAAAAFLPALFFKEMALSFPLLILAYWYFFPGKNGWKGKVIYGMPFVAVVAAYVAIRIAVLGRFSESSHLWQVSWRMASGAVALLGQHAMLFCWPLRLSLFRAFNLAASLHSPWPPVALLTLAAALLLRPREPLLGFLVVWWGVTLAPCLDFRQVNAAVSDRFSLLPTVGPCLALAGFALDWLPKRLARPQTAAILAPALGVLALLWTVQDVRTVRHWHDNVSLWDQAYVASPDSPVARMLRGALLQQRDGKLDAAAAEYKIALELNAASPRPLPGVTAECETLLGEVANFQGRTDEAISHYQRALRAVPGYSLAYKALGIVYFPRGNYAQAKVYFQRAVQLDPEEVESRFYLGTCDLMLGRPREAAAQFHAAREVDATYVEAYAAEARALEAAGDRVGAARVRALIAKR
jgi:tetratricopeptide (TPR) repeat protein